MPRRVQEAPQDGSESRPPPPYIDPWTVVRGDSEPLLRAQNPTYGTVELGEIHTGIQKASGLRKIGIACLLLGLVVGYFLNEPLNKGWHEMMRRRWAGEENHRAIIREEWAVEARRHETERAATREAWAVEAQRHETEHAAKREAWAIEARRHDTERAAMHEERRKWDRERREKEEKVKQEKEEEARKRESIAWVGLEPGHCLRYRLKEYTAVLSHVPLGIDGIEECWKKSVEIHGREWFPSQCEDQGLCGKVTGHWQVDMNEPSCTPWWDYPTDKGCAERGIRRYEARLLDLQDSTDWPVICSTAPANISGTWYERPTSCEHWGGDVWGKWFINDETCR